MKKIMWMALALSAVTTPAQVNQTAMEQQTVLNLHTGLYKTLVNKDEPQLRNCLAEAFVFTSANADVQYKEAFIKDFAMNPQIKLPLMSTSDQKITVVNNTAVLTALIHINIIRNIQKDNTAIELWERLTETYIKQEGQWRLLALHATYVPNK